MGRGTAQGVGDAKAGGNAANLGFEDKLWTAADKMRGSMDAAENIFRMPGETRA